MELNCIVEIGMKSLNIALIEIEYSNVNYAIKFISITAIRSEKNTAKLIFNASQQNAIKIDIKVVTNTAQCNKIQLK